MEDLINEEYYEVSSILDQLIALQQVIVTWNAQSIFAIKIVPEKIEFLKSKK